MSAPVVRCSICTATLSCVDALEAHLGDHGDLGQEAGEHPLSFDHEGTWVYALCGCGWASLLVRSNSDASDRWHDHKLVLAKLQGGR